MRSPNGGSGRDGKRRLGHVVNPRRVSRSLRAWSLPTCIAAVLSCGGGASPYVIADRPVAPSTTPQGSDQDALRTAFPQAEWLDLVELNPSRLRVRVEVNGRSTEAVLDTGASTTTLDLDLAGALGVRPGTRGSGTFEDATGQTRRDIGGVLDTLTFGRVTLRDVPVSATGGTRLDAVLVGIDVLAQFDLFVATDAYVVGLFPAGSAPAIDGETVVPLATEPHSGRLQLTGRAPGANGWVDLPLVVDTGATGSVIDVRTGLAARFAADVSFTTQLESVSGAVEARGQFVLAPLMLGTFNAGTVRVWTRSIQRTHGLLGMDVLAAQRVIISPQKRRLRFHPAPTRPAHRARGPGGAPCADLRGAQRHCIDVSMKHEPSRPPALCVHAPGYASARLELAVKLWDDNGTPLLGPGGVLQMHVVGRTSPLCFPAQPKTRALFDQTRRVELSWVRVGDDATWPCPGQVACWSLRPLR